MFSSDNWEILNFATPHRLKYVTVFLVEFLVENKKK